MCLVGWFVRVFWFVCLERKFGWVASYWFGGCLFLKRMPIQLGLLKNLDLCKIFQGIYEFREAQSVTELTFYSLLTTEPFVVALVTFNTQC